MPHEDSLSVGYKFPFNACEILCSENNFIVDKLTDVVRIDEGRNSSSGSYTHSMCSENKPKSKNHCFDSSMPDIDENNFNKSDEEIAGEDKEGEILINIDEEINNNEPAEKKDFNPYGEEDENIIFKDVEYSHTMTKEGFKESSDVII
jgi:hypothetical protein